MNPPLFFRWARHLFGAGSLLFSCLFTACHGRSSVPQHPAAAADYFSGPALSVALACQHDDADALEKALATTHVSPNEVGAKGMSLLLLALRNRSKNAMLTLLRHRANPNLETKLSAARVPVQPVAMAAGGDDTELLTILLDHGGDPNSRYNGDPAIFGAASHDRYDQVGLLLDRGADINAIDKHGDPLLVLCTSIREFDHTLYLLERGADAQKTDAKGYSTAFYLQDQGFRYKPGDPLYPWVIKAKHLLEAKSIHFPVPNPRVAHRAQIRAENAQRRQWEATPEGRRMVEFFQAGERARALGQPSPDYTAMLNQRMEAERAFQAWRKTQPNWFRPTGIWADKSSLYPVPTPTPASEAAEEARRKEYDQANSARWAQQAAALH